MNKIAYLAAGAASAERGRERMKRAGCTPKGHLLWTKEEEDIVRRHAGDYQGAVRALGGRRSYSAVRSRSQALGLAPKRTHWTGEQVLRLRKVYRWGTPAEMREAFPGRSLGYIHNMARYFGLSRPRKPFAPTGFPVLDEIRRRCFECALSMVDLDAMAGTGTYFASAGWHARHLRMSAVAKAVKALGGELTVKWDDPPGDMPTVTPLPRLMPAGRLSSAQVVPLAA